MSETAQKTWTVDELKGLEGYRRELELQVSIVNRTPAGNLEAMSRAMHRWHLIATRLENAGVYLPASSRFAPRCEQLNPEYSEAVYEARIQGLLE